MLFHELIKCNPKFYLNGWELYIELFETRHNVEKISFYKWDSIIYDDFYNEIMNLCKNNLKDNIGTILFILEKNIIENINSTNGYSYNNDTLNIEWWVLEDLVKCTNCGDIWDGFAQCTCYMYDEE